MLTLVPTPIGNLGDITFRALEALKECEVLLCEDTRVAKKLLTLLSDRYSLDFGQKRFVALHEHNQKEFLGRIDPSFFDRAIVYMSDAGMPGISDPGAMLVRYAQERGIEYDVLPGPSAAITAYAASGFLETDFCFFGFLPPKEQARLQTLGQILAHSSNTIFYEAPHRLLKTLQAIVQLDPKRILFLAKELTKVHQKYYKGEAQELLERLQKEPIKGEWVVVVRKGEGRKASVELGIEELMGLPLPKKELAKLLSKADGRPVKEWYELLTKD